MTDHSPPSSSLSLPRIRLLRPLLILAGVVLIGYLIHRIGPAAILSAFQSLSWRLMLVLVFPARGARDTLAVGVGFLVAAAVMVVRMLDPEIVGVLRRFEERFPS